MQALTNEYPQLKWHYLDVAEVTHAFRPRYVRLTRYAKHNRQKYASLCAIIEKAQNKTRTEQMVEQTEA
ncbi:hypothetical protein KIN20_010634 [Parelaphostrongylus tenuis]|uniref:Uncharacterized protein n=1 Tax=Parelaphostrongylus tenuis TaxID=148309 RepID=A0AAD5MCT8_PARTN|nr:hypothetical protein KIN20_010634 [Parelaphostrongylus tenuis]